MRIPRNQSDPTTTPPLGSVSTGEIMPAREFCRRMGLHRKAWDALRKRGFPVIVAGRQRIVDGKAAAEFFEGLAHVNINLHFMILRATRMERKAGMRFLTYRCSVDVRLLGALRVGSKDPRRRMDAPQHALVIIGNRKLAWKRNKAE